MHIEMKNLKFKQANTRLSGNNLFLFAWYLTESGKYVYTKKKTSSGIEVFCL